MNSMILTTDSPICPIRTQAKHKRFRSSVFRDYNRRQAFTAWQEQLAPWHPNQCFSYFKVLGPKQLGNIGSIASISLQLFLVSLPECREFCLSMPLRCSIEILSKKTVCTFSGQKAFSVDALINDFQDKAFLVKYPKRQLIDQDFHIHIPDERFTKFHLVYVPKSPDEYRGVIDCWFHKGQTLPAYVPPRYQYNALSTPVQNSPHYLSYRVENSPTELAAAADQHQPIVLRVHREVSTTTRQPKSELNRAFALLVQPDRFFPHQFEPQIEPSVAIKPLPPLEDDGEPDYVTPSGYKIARQYLQNFIDDFEIQSYSLASPSKHHSADDFFHFSGHILNTTLSAKGSLPVIAPEPTVKSATVSSVASHSCLESDLFASGGRLQLIVSNQKSYINYIDNRNLPSIGVFPFSPEKL